MPYHISSLFHLLDFLRVISVGMDSSEFPLSKVVRTNQQVMSSCSVFSSMIQEYVGQCSHSPIIRTQIYSTHKYRIVSSRTYTSAILKFTKLKHFLSVYRNILLNSPTYLTNFRYLPRFVEHFRIFNKITPIML